MGRKTKISTNILHSNILFYIKQNKINIGDFEKLVGVSSGYISRANKGNSTSIDFIVKAAKIMGITIDDLINIDLEQKYLENVWTEIIGDTVSNKEKEKFKKLIIELDSRNIITINREII